MSQKKKPCCFFWIAEKTESLLGTAEDKETTEQDGKKLSEQEVSPLFFFSSTIHHFNSVLLYCLFRLLMVHHTSTALILLRGLFCQTWTPFNSPLCPLPTFLFLLLLPCLVCFPPSPLSRPPVQIQHLRRQLTAKRARPAQKRKQEMSETELSRPPQRRSHLPTKKSPL